MPGRARDRERTMSTGGIAEPGPAPSRVGRLLIALSDGLDRAATFCAVSATCAFAAVMLVGIFFRYVLNASLSWSDEVALIVFGWAAFLFIASAYLHDRHMRVEVLVHKLPQAMAGSGRASRRTGLRAGICWRCWSQAFRRWKSQAGCAPMRCNCR